MTQIALGVGVAIDTSSDKKEECVFCQDKHQDSEKSSSEFSKKDTKKLKKQGQEFIKGDSQRLSFYPDKDYAPLVNWQSDITITKGFKAAAHHCMAFKTVKAHKIAGELKDAGYDPDEGSNCILLPYSGPQFSRVRAYEKRLQKHSGGHTPEYFSQVAKHIDDVCNALSEAFCPVDEKVPAEILIELMKSEELMIWMGVATSTRTAYQLHNNAYLDPYALWGEFKDEQDSLGNPISPKKDMLKDKTPQSEDKSEEEKNADDPE